jgi:peroxiredoxin
MTYLRTLIIPLLLFSIFGFDGDKGNLPSTLGKKINNFSLQNVDGKSISLSDFTEAKGLMVVFTCNHCPFAKLYSKRLNDLNKKYTPLGVPLIAINSMDTLVYDEESFELMQMKAKSDSLNFPYLRDALQIVGRNFGANHTPQAYVIWKEGTSWIVKYSGAIDDDGSHPEKANSYMANATDELLRGSPVSNPETRSFGCRIFYRK